MSIFSRKKNEQASDFKVANTQSARNPECEATGVTFDHGFADPFTVICTKSSAKLCMDCDTAKSLEKEFAGSKKMHREVILLPEYAIHGKHINGEIDKLHLCFEEQFFDSKETRHSGIGVTAWANDDKLIDIEDCLDSTGLRLFGYRQHPMKCRRMEVVDLEVGMHSYATVSEECHTSDEPMSFHRSIILNNESLCITTDSGSRYLIPLYNTPSDFCSCKDRPKCKGDYCPLCGKKIKKKE